MRVSGDTAAVVVSEAHDVLQDMENQIAELKACALEARRQAIDKEVAAQGKETASAEQAARAFKSAFLDKLDKLADRSRQRDDLLAEAQRRYASETKTLQAVRKLITDQARARGVN